MYYYCIAPSVPVKNVSISNATNDDSIAVFIEWYPPADPIGAIPYYHIRFMQVADPLDDGNVDSGDSGDNGDRRKRNIPLNDTVMNSFVNITESSGVSINITLSGLGQCQLVNEIRVKANHSNTI